MSFNKVYLPEKEELKKRLKEDREATLRWLQKADAFIGPSDSMRLVNKELAKENKNL